MGRRKECWTSSKCDMASAGEAEPWKSHACRSSHRPLCRGETLELVHDADSSSPHVRAATCWTQAVAYCRRAGQAPCSQTEIVDAEAFYDRLRQPEVSTSRGCLEGHDVSNVVLTIRSWSRCSVGAAADATMAIGLHSLEVARRHVGQ
jgi:hypothetical protein